MARKPKSQLEGFGFEEMLNRREKKGREAGWGENGF
jgi:hypothetical protein